MNTSIKQYDFLAPFVPAADVLDGLLQAAELDHDLIVKIQVWVCNDIAGPSVTVLPDHLTATQ